MKTTQATEDDADTQQAVEENGSTDAATVPTTSDEKSPECMKETGGREETAMEETASLKSFSNGPEAPSAGTDMPSIAVTTTFQGIDARDDIEAASIASFDESDALPSVAMEESASFISGDHDEEIKGAARSSGGPSKSREYVDEKQPSNTTHELNDGEFRTFQEDAEVDVSLDSVRRSSAPPSGARTHTHGVEVAGEGVPGLEGGGGDEMEEITGESAGASMAQLVPALEGEHMNSRPSSSSVHTLETFSPAHVVDVTGVESRARSKSTSVGDWGSPQVAVSTDDVSELGISKPQTPSGKDDGVLSLESHKLGSISAETGDAANAPMTSPGFGGSEGSSGEKLEKSESGPPESADGSSGAHAALRYDGESSPARDAMRNAAHAGPQPLVTGSISEEGALDVLAGSSVDHIPLASSTTTAAGLSAHTQAQVSEDNSTDLMEGTDVALAAGTETDDLRSPGLVSDELELEASQPSTHTQSHSLAHSSTEGSPHLRTLPRSNSVDQVSVDLDTMEPQLISTMLAPAVGDSAEDKGSTLSASETAPTMVDLASTAHLSSDEERQQSHGRFGPVHSLKSIPEQLDEYEAFDALSPEDRVRIEKIYTAWPSESAVTASRAPSRRKSVSQASSTVSGTAGGPGSGGGGGLGGEGEALRSQPRVIHPTPPDRIVELALQYGVDAQFRLSVCEMSRMQKKSKRQ